MMKLFTFLFSISYCLLCFGQGLEVKGRVYDQNSGSGIPFATIHIEGTSVGTCANLEGTFKLKIPDSNSMDRLLISSMGYEVVYLDLSKSGEGDIDVPLTQSIVDLGSVTIRPISAQEYIKRAVKKFPDNYATSFSSNAYFRQLALDSDNALQFSEGYMQTYFGDFLNDTTTIEQRLLLHQSESNPDLMVFRKQKREKKLNKARKQAERDGIVLDEDSVKRKAGKVGIGIATPDLLMSQDPVRQIESFLDSTQYKNFEYQFEEDLIYRGKKSTVISFKTKRKVKLENISLNGHVEGVIYFDQESDAIIGVDYDAEMVIPLAVRPLLLVAGFGASNPRVANKVRYLQVGDKWYPQSIQVEMGMDLTQRYWFKKNETSSLDMEVLMAITNINAKEPIRIPEEFKFDSGKELEEQIYPLKDSSWDKVNRIALEGQ